MRELMRLLASKSVTDIADYTIIEAKKRITYLENKSQDLEEAIKNMRYTYLKELQGLKEQIVHQNEYPESFESVIVQYFSGLEVLDVKTRELLNKKLEDVKEDYNSKLLKIIECNK
jgi:hypothetical protein